METKNFDKIHSIVMDIYIWEEDRLSSSGLLIGKEILDLMKDSNPESFNDRELFWKLELFFFDTDRVSEYWQSQFLKLEKIMNKYPIDYLNFNKKDI